MARWGAHHRVAALKLLLLLLLPLLLAGTAARPFDTQSLPSHPATSGISTLLPGHLAVRLAQDVQANSFGASNNDFAKVFIAIGGALALAMILSLLYSIHYRHAKLQLQRQYLDQRSPLPPEQAQQPAQGQCPAGDVVRPSALRRTTAGVAADNYGLALFMASSAQLSPAVYAALMEQEASSPNLPIESKMKAIPQEEKVLGRREDFRALGSRSGQNAAPVRIE